MTDNIESTRRERWYAVATWFLFLSYAFGSPAFAIVEARTSLFSEKFAYPAEFLYLVSGLQFVGALALFKRALAPWSLAVLTVFSLGAAMSHLKINSPLTALPAIAYTAIQVWCWFHICRRHF